MVPMPPRCAACRPTESPGIRACPSSNCPDAYRAADLLVHPGVLEPSASSPWRHRPAACPVRHSRHAHGPAGLRRDSPPVGGCQRARRPCRSGAALRGARARRATFARRARGSGRRALRLGTSPSSTSFASTPKRGDASVGLAGLYGARCWRRGIFSTFFTSPRFAHAAATGAGREASELEGRIAQHPVSKTMSFRITAVRATIFFLPACSRRA